MAVTDVNKIKHSATNTEEGSRRTETYRVVFDAIPTDIGDALTADDGGTSIPTIGASYLGSTSVKCKTVGPVQETNSRLIYEVPVQYDNINRSGSGFVSSNPLLRPAEIVWGFDVISVVLEKDKDGNAVENSAGYPFRNPTLEELVFRPVCTIIRNVSSHSPADANAKIDTVNSNAITIAGVSITAGQALMKDYGGVASYDGGIDYVQQRFEIQFAPTHDVEVGDMGMFYIDASDDDKKKPFLDGENNVIRVPMYLDSNGDDGGGVERFLTFTVKNETNWSALGLPTTFPDF